MSLECIGSWNIHISCVQCYNLGPPGMFFINMHSTLTPQAEKKYNKQKQLVSKRVQEWAFTMLDSGGRGT